MLQRTLHSSVSRWKFGTKYIKRTFYFSSIKDALILNSFIHQKPLLNTNSLSSKKCNLDFHCWNKINVLRTKKLHYRSLYGTSTRVKNDSVSLHLARNCRNLSSQNGQESAPETMASKQEDKVSHLQTFYLTKRNLISVAGPDSANFLQGLITNDMNIFQNGNQKSIYSMILNVQGRVLYDIIIYAVPNQTGDESSFYLECDSDVSADIIKFFKRYKIRKKVKVTDLKGEYKSWASLSSPQQIKDSFSEDEASKMLLCENDPRVPTFGSRIILPHDTTVISDNERDYHLKRYQLGIGEGIEDLPPGNCYPLECNLPFKNGVSFQKGCYIGQELTARTHHTGVVRKRLMPIIFESEPEGLNAGDQISDMNGKNLGKFRSFLGTYGLALLRISQALKANESGMNIKGYKLNTQIPDWWPKQKT